MRTTRLQPDRRRAAGSGQGRRAIGSAGVTPHAIETSPAATPLRPRRASRRRAPACAAYVLNVKHRRMIRTRGRRSTRVGCAPPGFRRFRRGVFPRLDPGVERADECSRLMGEGLSSGYGVQDQVPARVRWRMSGCAAELLRVAVERVDPTPDRRIGSRMSVAVVGRGAQLRWWGRTSERWSSSCPRGMPRTRTGSGAAPAGTSRTTIALDVGQLLPRAVESNDTSGLVSG